MRIVDIRETAIPLKSQRANSSFDFSEMTMSVVAVITDVVRGGKPLNLGSTIWRLPLPAYPRRQAVRPQSIAV